MTNLGVLAEMGDDAARAPDLGEAFCQRVACRLLAMRKDSEAPLFPVSP
jgi:hypothetical protein